MLLSQCNSITENIFWSQWKRNYKWKSWAACESTARGSTENRAARRSLVDSILCVSAKLLFDCWCPALAWQCGSWELSFLVELLQPFITFVKRRAKSKPLFIFVLSYYMAEHIVRKLCRICVLYVSCNAGSIRGTISNIRKIIFDQS